MSAEVTYIGERQLGIRAIALLRRLLGGKSWLIAQDQETGRATFVSAGADNADLSLGDEVTAMAEDLGLTPPNVLSS